MSDISVSEKLLFRQGLRQIKDSSLYHSETSIYTNVKVIKCQEKYPILEHDMCGCLNIRFRT